MKKAKKFHISDISFQHSGSRERRKLYLVTETHFMLSAEILSNTYAEA
jgi:hypothetical protein